MTQKQAKRIETNPDILVGKPVIKGTRVPVSLILNLLAHGYTAKRIIAAYPILKRQDITAAVDFSELSNPLAIQETTNRIREADREKSWLPLAKVREESNYLD